MNWDRRRAWSAWRLAIPVALALAAAQAFADVTITDRAMVARHREAQAKAEKHNRPSGVQAQGGMGAHALATGSVALIDASGVKYFINDNITFSTSSSGSGAMSEASYTHAVAASTLNGGTVNSTLNDAFDGYNELCVSFTGALGPCQTGSANYVPYIKNGPSTTECSGRQAVFPTMTSGQVQMFRKVYVPTSDSFARWLNIFTNTGGSAVTFNMVTGNNLGSDSNTLIVSSSSGNAAAELSDLWVSTFQNFSGTTSSDPRLGHVLQGSAAATPLASIHFADGDDNPYWGYTLTLAPGQTKIIMNFVAVQPSRTAANTKASQLASLSPGTLNCMSVSEINEVVNFAAAQVGESIPAFGTAGRVALILLLAAVGVLVLVRLRAGH